MTGPQILILADTSEAEAMLRNTVDSAGYICIIPEQYSDPSDGDIILVDVTHLRGDPLASLQTQRHLGQGAPAILIAPRLTTEMSEVLFALKIRGFIRKPFTTLDLLEQIEALIAHILSEQDQTNLRVELEASRQSLSRRIGELKALSRIGQAIVSTTDLSVSLTRIAEAAAFLTRADQVVIYLWDKQERALLVQTSHGIEPAVLNALAIPSKETDAFQALSTGQKIVREPGESGHEVVAGYRVFAALTVPVIVNRQVQGVIAAYNQSKRSFDADDQAVLSSLADYTAIALDKAWLIEDAQRRLDESLIAPRNIRLHAETLLDPVDGIEAQVDTLLSGGFGPLTEAQHTAVTHIKQAADRLTEITGFIREELARFDDPPPA
nr:GAF domain-containing protein [Anaerolineae bacterium]